MLFARKIYPYVAIIIAVKLFIIFILSGLYNKFRIYGFSLTSLNP